MSTADERCKLCGMHADALIHSGGHLRRCHGFNGFTPELECDRCHNGVVFASPGDDHGSGCRELAGVRLRADGHRPMRVCAGCVTELLELGARYERGLPLPTAGELSAAIEIRRAKAR